MRNGEGDRGLSSSDDTGRRAAAQDQAAPATLCVGGYFDGERRHDGGPWRLLFDHDGTLREVLPATPGTALDAAFLMPSLVEGHAHLFLDGGERDTAARAEHMKADVPTMLRTGRANLALSRAAGLGLVRDAGDRWGINHALRDECRATPGIQVRSAGIGLRRPKRYGGFMGREVSSDEEIIAAVREFAETSDDIKILLTGIIDFAKASVPGAPQFDVETLKLIVRAAHECGRPTLTHCSGEAGLEVAVEGGVDSIEHGFFLNRSLLQRMADRAIAWVPTFSPVAFQAREPQWVGWTEEMVQGIAAIVEAHRDAVLLGHALGVPIVSGSDAGSHGVPHGAALIDEMLVLAEIGVPMDAVLKSATSLPRRLWRAPANDIVVGARPDMLLLAASPFADAGALRQPVGVGGATRLAGMAAAHA